MEASGFKRCPFCKEMIRQEAVKCRFCGEWLEQNTSINPVSAQATTQAESVRPPSVPEPNEPPPPATDANQVLNPEGERKGTTAKNLNWISAILLSVCVLVWVIGLAAIPWTELSPEKQGIVTEKLGGAFLRLILCAGLFTWAVKRKGYRLLTFSVVCTVMTGISAYYFQVGKQQSTLRTQQSNRKVASNLIGIYSNQLKFIQSGATNIIPNNISPTGDAENDAILLWADTLSKDSSQFLVNMNTEIGALQERDVFDTSFLTNKSALDAEISKRIQHQKIIEKYHAGWLPMLESAKQTFNPGNISDNVRDQILSGVEISIQKYSSQANQVFQILSEANQSELQYLRFMDSTFGDYQVKDDTISFTNPANSQKYSQLTKRIQDAANDVDDFRAQYLKKSETTKQQVIQEFSK